jgi:hypothetical protein
MPDKNGQIPFLKELGIIKEAKKKKITQINRKL